MKVILTNTDILRLAQSVAKAISDMYRTAPFKPGHTVASTGLKVYPVPRGGVPAAYAVYGAWLALRANSPYMMDWTFVDSPEEADFAIDDVIDSGRTAERLSEGHDLFTFALVDKRVPDSPYAHSWIVFPWETSMEAGIEDHIVRLLEFVGEDPNRGGLLETPARVAKAWKFWCGGYSEDPASILKVFEDGAEKCDEMVLVKDIPIYSHCEHHLAPIFGKVTIAYIPNGKIVGLSKLSRLANAFARRLQVQERLTNQIADALNDHLGARAVGVILKARHMCMESRGVCQQGHHTITSALRGRFIEDTEAGRAARAEFMKLAE